jgi:hypothetical protein
VARVAKYYRQVQRKKPEEKYAKILKWLDEVIEMEYTETERYSTTIILTEPRKGFEKEFYYHARKIKLLNAATYTLLGGKLEHEP